MLTGDYNHRPIPIRSPELPSNSANPNASQESQIAEKGAEQLGKKEDKEKKLGEVSQSVDTHKMRQNIINFQTTLSEILVTDMENAPLLAKEMALNPTQFNTFINTSIIDIPLSEAAAKSPINYKKMLNSIDSYKEKLGAKSDEARPDLKLNETFLFFSINIIRNFVSKALRNNWAPSTLWNLVGKKIGLKAEGMSKYEYISLMIQGCAKVKDNLDEIKRRLIEDDNPHQFVQEISGLYIHTGLNSAQTLIESIEGTLKILEEQFAYHESQGTLEDFFNEAFDDGNICFEARARYLQEYASIQPTEKGVEIVDVKLILDYTKESAFEKIFEEEIKVFREKKIREGSLSSIDTPKADEFEDYLIEERKIYEIEGKDSMEEIRPFRQADVERLIAYFRDEIMILE
ncbi:Uncharacterized protein PRO82_001343 [Candidatus Protochlamydia amoebophila]|uniref:hypothetical protein n=1 Tax=Candidatus Protochlamydia amoebophila TaxID=362787 RepID=UPI001BC9BE00|nr:hypothetical protein [Candidatus Protochlamydia amoebophila]MBS4164030.1 Uncharacterized protein [Candidatus Protochlamydia amoebophila]